MPSTRASTNVPVFFFFFNDTATTEIYTLSLHDALPISWRAVRPARTRRRPGRRPRRRAPPRRTRSARLRSEEHTSELQSQSNLVCRLLLEKKKKNHTHKENDTCNENSYGLVNVIDCIRY